MLRLPGVRWKLARSFLGVLPCRSDSPGVRSELSGFARSSLGFGARSVLARRSSGVRSACIDSRRGPKGYHVYDYSSGTVKELTSIPANACSNKGQSGDYWRIGGSGCIAKSPVHVCIDGLTV